jgi:hypothetical protein
MSDEDPKISKRDAEGNPGGGQFADPNREAVGLEPAWAEGNGGSDTNAGGGPTRRAASKADPTPDEGKGEHKARRGEPDPKPRAKDD